MRTKDSRAIIRIKTRELSRQLEIITSTVKKLREEIAHLEEPSARFEALRRGLLLVHGEAGRVFEDASFADGVAEEIQCGTADLAMIRAANVRLERELDCVARRAATAVVYGRLFDETEVEVETTKALPGLEQARTVLHGYWSTAANIDTGKLRSLLEECVVDAPNIPTDTSLFQAPVSQEEVLAHLQVLSRSFDHREELRFRARRILGDVEATNDLAGALTILARDPSTWRWEDWPTRVRLRWNRTRWRAFLDPDLIPQLFLEVMALRLAVWAKTSWLPRTLAARRREWDVFDHARHDLASAIVLPGFSESISAYAHQAPNAYGGAGSITGEPDYFQKLFALVSADLWWQKTTSPPIGSYDAAQTDLLDFFPSLPHSTIHTLLDVMRVPAPISAFVTRYLTGPYQLDEEKGTTELRPRTGMFPGNTLSRVLGDSLLMALDAHVERTAGVPVARFMDDIYWVAPSPKARAAWDAIEEFCKTAGLRPNRAKTAAQRFGSGAEPELPNMSRSTIRWGFLELGADGAWTPHLPTIQNLTQSLRVRLEAPAPVRQLVREYNSALGYLVRGLAPLHAFDVAHLERLHAPLSAIHADIFGPGEGIITLLRDRLMLRLAELKDCIASLPRGWFYWPATAGGLGVYNPASMLAGVRAALTTHPPLPTQRSKRPPREDAQLCMLYAAHGRADLRLAPPRPSPEMEGRQRDFVTRGVTSIARGHVTHGTGLQPYWQWLLESHGPSLVEFFGTLRFLGSEVVPVQPVSMAPLLQNLSTDDDIPF